MNRFAILAASLLLTSSLALAQSAAPAQQTTPVPAAAAQATTPAAQSSMPHGVFPVGLSRSLDSKKLKEGDKVYCTTTATVHMSNFVIPAGAKVLGHVTQAKARSKGDSESSLGIQFDEIQLPGGKTVPMKGVPQAFAPNPGGTGGPDTGVGGGGTLPGPGGETIMPPPTDTALAGANSGYHPLNNRGAVPLLTSQSTGILGLHNLELDKNSILTSTGKEVKLDSGVQILIRAEVQVPVQ